MNSVEDSKLSNAASIIGSQRMGHLQVHTILRYALGNSHMGNITVGDFFQWVRALSNNSLKKKLKIFSHFTRPLHSSAIILNP